jgi:hypothetical protein
MAENQEGPSIIESLAMVTDAMQTLFPDGKLICVYELNEEDFKKVQTNFRKIDQQNNRFSINISGLEHVFILENSIQEPITEPKPVEIKKTKIQKLFSFFKGGSRSV